MKTIRKNFNLNRLEYYKRHFKIVNSVIDSIHLTDKEVDVLAAFLAVDEKLVEGDRFNTLIRTLVKKKLEISHGGLGNYLNSLVKKKFIHKTRTGKLIINPSIIPSVPKQSYQFTINLGSNDSKK